MAELKRINGTPLVIAGSRSGVLYDVVDKEVGLDVRFFEMVQDTTLTPSGFGYVNSTQIQGTEIGWGDGSFFVVTTNSAFTQTHTYATPGQYKIRAVGSYISRSNDADAGLVDVTRWDNFDFTDQNVFGGLRDASFATISASGGPTGFRGTGTIDADLLFSNCTNFTGGIGHWVWDNTRVYNIANMFDGCSNFNEDLSGWTGMRPTTMVRTFKGCTIFNSSVANWDLSQCNSLSYCFEGADAFTQPLTSWDVSNVTDFSFMFNGCNDFNGDMSTWQIRNDGTPVSMAGMFRSTDSFAGDISTDAANGYWVMSDVTSVNDMFEFAGPNCNPTMNNWDLSSCTNMTQMFNNAGGAFQGNGCDTWTLNTATPVLTDGMFNTCPNFNADISGWDVSQFSSVVMFNGCTNFNRDLSSWAVTSSNIGSAMFQSCTNFNAGLGYGVAGTRLSGWNLTGYTGSLGAMFNNARAFNQDISTWDVSGVTSMGSMFNTAQSFNQDISAWNTGSVTSMQAMFNGASSFSQPIGTWNTSNVSNMSLMFRNNSTFNEDISGWSIASLTNASQFFTQGGLSTANYDALLDSTSGWPSQSTIQNNTTLAMATSRYTGGSNAETGRNLLTGTYGWTITDGGPV